MSSEEVSLNESFILASGSEIRKKILSDYGFNFIVHKSEIDEEKIKKQIFSDYGLNFIVHKSKIDEESLKDYYNDPPFVEIAITLALAKAKEVSEVHHNKYVLGADQMCVYRNKVLNKPGNEENAINNLKLLSGHTHFQYCGMAICLNGKTIRTFYDIAILTMKDLSENDIRSYVKKDEPYECAGSYKYESHGSELFSEVKGSSYTIQGLVIIDLLKAFEDLGLSFQK